AVLLSIFLILFTVPITTTQAATEEEIEQSIDLALDWLVSQQDPAGYWGYNIYMRIAETCFALVKLQERAYDLYLDPFDPGYEYAPNVSSGWEYVLPFLINIDLSVQPHGDPDTNGNGKGLRIDTDYYRRIYFTSICLMAVSATGKNDRENELKMDYNGDGNPDTYGEIAQDIVDWLAQAQADDVWGRGGWYYGDSSSSADNSNGGYAVLGLAAAEGFGSIVPQFVKEELSIWIDYIQSVDGGSGYSNPESWENLLKTGNLIFQMTFCGDEPDSPRFLAAMDYIETHWHDENLQPGWGYNQDPPAHYQAMYCLMKGFEYSQIELLDLDGDDIPEHDWFEEFSTVLINHQEIGGYWPDSPCYVWYDSPYPWGTMSGEILSTIWALLVLERIAPPPPFIPVNIDIKPGSWPNPINLKSDGVLPVAICGTEEFDVTTIDPASIILTSEESEEGVSPLRWSLEDVATPYTEDDEGGHELTDDGYLDLVLHFDSQEVVNTLILTYYIGETIPLIIEGNLMEEYDGTAIKGQDYVRILGKALEPIFIDDDGEGDFTWKEASKQWWCQGAGTELDPYLIENVKINGAGSLFCIRVYNSDAHFIIKNCILYGMDVTEAAAAIVLLNTENGLIVDNSIIDNGNPLDPSVSAISILDSDNNVIMGNDCTGNVAVGIYVASSSNNEILENYCRESIYGIIIVGESVFTLGNTAENNLVEDNTISNNVEYGILLQIEANYNEIIANRIAENNIGILFVDGSDDNNIFENTIENNQGGIYFHWLAGMDHCIDNNIDYNDFLYNIWPWAGVEETPMVPPQWWQNNNFGPNNYVFP
ncbi:MAG: nitrous oxide reductase family maturation protein NosD, partial [Promethearchaeota archaeon]